MPAAPVQLIASLQRQLTKYEDAIAEFLAIETELRHRKSTARVADLIRVNRETINAIERSAELVRLRITAAERGGSTAPFAVSQRPHEG